METHTLYDVYYTTESGGEGGTAPIIHLCCRDEQRRKKHVEVEGFRPYFCTLLSEALDRSQTLAADDRVLEVDAADAPDCTDACRGVTDERLARIICRIPGDVATLRETFSETWEADVLFGDRFCIDQDIVHQFAVPDGIEDGGRVHVDEIESADSNDTPPVEPRVVTYDIEVRQNDGDGPSVVSEKGTEWAPQPITAITAHDSYTDAYHVYVLANAAWGTDGREAAETGAREAIGDAMDVTVYSNEVDLLGDFCEWLSATRPDVLTGWNANGFDTPYFVNRCFEKDVYAVKDCSPTGDVSRMHGEGKWLNSDLKGIVCFDLLDGYEKCQRHELDSYALANVAAEETDFEKLDVGDIDEVWAADPAEFVRYNCRDTQATVAINEEVGVV